MRTPFCLAEFECLWCWWWVCVGVVSVCVCASLSLENSWGFKLLPYNHTRQSHQQHWRTHHCRHSWRLKIFLKFYAFLFSLIFYLWEWFFFTFFLALERKDYQKLFTRLETRVRRCQLAVVCPHFSPFFPAFRFLFGLWISATCPDTFFAAHLPLTGALHRLTRRNPPLDIISMKLIDNCRILWHICKTVGRPWRVVSIRPRQDAGCFAGRRIGHAAELRAPSPGFWRVGPCSEV